ncbi:MAG: hypothetical protein ACYTBP_14290 [Planctomycetota bacterium]|jgi:hypothetical protein
MKRELITVMFVTGLFTCLILLNGCGSNVNSANYDADSAYTWKLQPKAYSDFKAAPDTPSNMVKYQKADRIVPQPRKLTSRPRRNPAQTFRTGTTSLTMIQPETPFGQAIQILSRSVDPPLNIFVNWKDLDHNADIDRTTAVNMKGMAGVSAGAHLKMMLEAVSGGMVDLGYTVDEGIIYIATTESLPSNQKIVVYDVTGLLSDRYSMYNSGLNSSYNGSGNRSPTYNSGSNYNFNRPGDRSSPYNSSPNYNYNRSRN